MPGWHSYNQHMTLKILTHPFPVFLCIWVSLCVGMPEGACIGICVWLYICVCVGLNLWNMLCPVIPWELAGHLPLPLITADSSQVPNLHVKELRVFACVSASVCVFACARLTVDAWLQQSSKIPPWLLIELEVASADTYLMCSLNASPVAFGLQLQHVSPSAH